MLPPVWDGGAVPLNTVYGVAVDGPDEALRWALWLNAAPVRWWVSVDAERALGGYLRFRERNVGSAPAPPPTADLSAMLRVPLCASQPHRLQPEQVRWAEVDAWAARALQLTPEEREQSARFSETSARKA